MSSKANGADSDTESQVSAAKSDPAEEEEESKISSRALNVGLPWIPEIEPVDMMVSSRAVCARFLRLQ